MAVLTRVAVCVVALMLTAACRTGQQQWGPFRGQVVDFDTGDPIAGAYVMAMWIRDAPSLHSGESFYDAQETRTGADGWFEIPYERRWLTAFVRRPDIRVFVPGYVAEGAAVVTGDGRPYTDPTFIGLRRLQPVERCANRPREPVVAGLTVPEYMNAVQQYNLRLECRS
jgi:hypothetical protein